VKGVQRETFAGYTPVWVKVDIVKETFPLRRTDPALPQSLDYERSLYGLAFDADSQIAFLPGELLARTLLNEEQFIRFDNIADYLTLAGRSSTHLSRLEKADQLLVYRFSTFSYFSAGDEAVTLYRQHRTYDDLPADDLIQVAIAGGNYLVDAVDQEGRFVYSYFPKADTESDSYNMVRHAGTIYSMMELYQIIGSEDLRLAGKRAIDYLLQSAYPCPGYEDLLCIVDSGEVRLGGNALAIVAIVKYMEVTGSREYLPQVTAMVRWIQATQAEDGEFSIHQETFPEGGAIDFVSEYYPGEALLALMRLYNLAPEPSLLDTAENGAQWLINVRDGDLSDAELIHDHWLLYGLNDLYRQRPNELYLNHAFRIVGAIIQSQNRDPIYPDWLGSYYTPPRSTPTATRSEALYAAYQLARDFGDPIFAQQILGAIKLDISFQLQTQFRPESVMYLDDPQRALGGFHRSLTNYEIRIDYVQHNLSSILGLYKIEADLPTP
jgi:hypothetical protein